MRWISGQARHEPRSPSVWVQQAQRIAPQATPAIGAMPFGYCTLRGVGGLSQGCPDEIEFRCGDGVTGMNALTAIDLAVASRFGDGQRAAAAALALASWANREGHAGLCLNALAAGEVAPAAGPWGGTLPVPALMLEALASHRNIGPPDCKRPFVIEHGLLYLRRTWSQEVELAERLSALAARQFPFDERVIEAASRALLPSPDEHAVARAALRQLICSGLTVLVGGPGTGKTWTAARLLAGLAQVSASPLRMAVAAPTGKAAARLSESLRVANLNQPALKATTLHRLLGVRPDTAEPRHHAAHPLAIDVLLLDEASMIDLPLMLRTLRALPPWARLILIGDPEQLPALGGGRVLADLLSIAASDATASVRPIQRIVHGLRHNHRFAKDSPIAGLLGAVRAADGAMALRIVQQGHAGLSAEWSDGDPFSTRWQAVWREGFADLRRGDVGQRLQALQRFRVLCAGNAGRLGVEGINQAAELACLGRVSRAAHYDGQPILIRENAPQLDLWNGDLGVLATDSGGRLLAWFSDADGAPRALRLDTLPAFDTAYAMSVHKAQGSEFEHVVLVLPEPDSPLLTRAWVYTALSRARHRIEVTGSAAALQTAIARAEQRWSRLPQRLLDRPCS